MISVRSLSRIVLICRDARGLAAFYHRAFGFVDSSESPSLDREFADLIGLAQGRVHVKLLRLGNQRLVLAQPDPPAAAYPDRIAGCDLRFQHFAIVVTDVKAALTRLQSLAGWKAISVGGPQTLPPSSGAVTAFKFRDPEGHPLELLAYPPTQIPARWTGESTKTCLGIDHSAISVSDTARSEAFYRELGLMRTAASLNAGPEQQRLDNVTDPIVEVTALAPAQPVPHVELLCYRGTTHRNHAGTAATDTAATQLVFEVPRHAFAPLLERMHKAVVRGPVVSNVGQRRALLRDPDGHWLSLESDGREK